MPFSPLSKALTLSNFLSLAYEPTLNEDLGSGQGGITISSFVSFFGISGVVVEPHPWTVMVSHGRPWPAIGGFGWPWPTMAMAPGFSKLWTLTSRTRNQ